MGSNPRKCPEHYNSLNTVCEYIYIWMNLPQINIPVHCKLLFLTCDLESVKADGPQKDRIFVLPTSTLRLGVSPPNQYTGAL
jgi:hypothetical protein